MAVCAILAAGRSARMGSDKSRLLFEGASLLERALAAAGSRRTALVVASGAAGLPAPSANLRILRNDAPELGMSHSLQLADAVLIPRSEPLVVLLVDTPLVDAALVDLIVDERGTADVAYPVRAGIPGHPVVFGESARARIASLPPGDSLRTLRDDASLTRRCLNVADDAPFLDVDTPREYERLVRAHKG